MSTAALALLAALAALVAVGVVAMIALRFRRASDSLLAAGLLEIGTRMDALASNLAATVEKVREDAMRARLLESLGQALDPEEVLTRCVEAAASLPGVGAARATIDVDGMHLEASAGLPDTGSPDPDSPRDRFLGAIGGPPDRSMVRAVGISYHYPPGEEEARAVWRSAIAVPLGPGNRRLGFLSVFGHDEEPPVAGREFAVVEAIAAHAGPAVEAALRRQSASRALPTVDPLTGLGNRQALHETLALEVARAHRRGRGLAACLLDVDDFRRTNDRVGQTEADSILVAIADLLEEALGPTDLAYRSGGDEFTVILPESGRIDAEALNARVQATLQRRLPSGARTLGLSAGIAELEPDDDGVSLFERAEQALKRAKHERKGTAA